MGRLMRLRAHQELQQSLLAGRRVAGRERIDASIGLRQSGSEWLEAGLVDVSPTGCKLNQVPDEVDSRSLWIRIGELEPLPVRVRWSRGTERGCEFLFALSPREHDLIVRTGQALREAEETLRGPEPEPTVRYAL
jgi:hypothetical protein